MGRRNETLGANGILLSPAHPTPPPYYYESYLKPFNFVYTAMHNALGLPATVVPIGLNQGGLPLSIQVSAAEYNPSHVGCGQTARETFWRMDSTLQDGRQLWILLKRL